MTGGREDRERRARVRATFDLASVGYDRSPLRFFHDGAMELVASAGLRPGDRVLDVATGTGWAALAAAAKVGPHGRVVGIDLSPEMLRKARKKASQENREKVEFRIADAMGLPYRSATFDVVLASQAIFFMPDPARALQEWRRVLKPGSRLAMASQGKAAFQPMMGMYVRQLERYGLPMPRPSGPDFDTAAECLRYMRAAGFDRITTRIVDLGYALPDARAWWTIVMGTAMGRHIRRLAPGVRAGFRREHLAAVESLRVRDGIILPMPTILAVGRKRQS